MKIYGYYNKITKTGTLIKIPQLDNLKKNSKLNLYINKFITKFNYNCFQILMNPEYIKISEKNIFEQEYEIKIIDFINIKNVDNYLPKIYEVNNILNDMNTNGILYDRAL